MKPYRNAGVLDPPHPAGPGVVRAGRPIFRRDAGLGPRGRRLRVQHQPAAQRRGDAAPRDVSADVRLRRGAHDHLLLVADGRAVQLGRDAEAGLADGLGDAAAAGRFGGGEPVGETTLSQVTIGFQLGGQSYSEIIFFEKKSVFEDFTTGKFEFAAQASAVAVHTGASADLAYHNNIAIVTMAKGGLMYEASVGGQKFSYKAYGKAEKSPDGEEAESAAKEAEEE